MYIVYFTCRFSELKEKMGEIQMEKEKDKSRLNRSYDSALGTDYSDADGETVDVEIDCSSSYSIGFSLAGGKNRPVCHNDHGLYVTSVARNGPADGKLKVNDCLLKVGHLNCASADPDSVVNQLRSAKMAVAITVKRRRFLHQGLKNILK